jgi:predicted transposase/invertase (TIGR01784 family)
VSIEVNIPNKMINLEKEKHVDYITSAEYFGIQKGMEQGMRKAQLDNAKKMLAKGIKCSIVKEITKLSDVELEAI